MLTLAPVDRIALYLTVALVFMAAVCVVMAILDSYRLQKDHKSSAKNRQTPREDSKLPLPQITPNASVPGQPATLDPPIPARQIDSNQQFNQEPLYEEGDVPPDFTYEKKRWFGGWAYFTNSIAHGNLGEQLTHRYFLTNWTKTRYERLPSKYGENQGIDGVYLKSRPVAGYAGTLICVETKTTQGKKAEYKQLSTAGLRTRAEKLIECASPKKQQTGRLIKTALRNRGRYRLKRWLVWHSLTEGKMYIYEVSDAGRVAEDHKYSRDTTRHIVRELNKRVKKGVCCLKRCDHSSSIKSETAKSDTLPAKHYRNRLPASPPAPSRQLVRREKLVVECDACDGVGHTRISKEFVCAECGGIGSRRATLTGLEFRCAACKGRGHIRKTKKNSCIACQGGGAVTQTIEIWSRFLRYELCKTCEGRGRIFAQRSRSFCAPCSRRIERCGACRGNYICQTHSSQKCDQCEVPMDRCSACDGDGYFDLWEEYEETN